MFQLIAQEYSTHTLIFLFNFQEIKRCSYNFSRDIIISYDVQFHQGIKTSRSYVVHNYGFWSQNDKRGLIILLALLKTTLKRHSLSLSASYLQKLYNCKNTFCFKIQLQLFLKHFKKQFDANKTRLRLNNKKQANPPTLALPRDKLDPVCPPHDIK